MGKALPLHPTPSLWKPPETSGWGYKEPEQTSAEGRGGRRQLSSSLLTRRALRASVGKVLAVKGEP